MKILSRYILKEHIAPFFISLGVVTMVLLIDRIIDLLNLIIEKKLPAPIIVEVFALSLPYMLALSIPMAVLVATILAFGRMTVDRETIAMKSSGINLYSMIKPLVVMAILLTGLMVYFNHWFLPETNHKLKNLMVKIAYYKPMTIIKAGEFTPIADYTVYAKDNEGDLLRELIIYDRSQTTFPRVIRAQTGTVQQMDRGNTLKLTLKNGEMHERVEKEPTKYSLRSFDTFVVHIRDLGHDLDIGESGYRTDREMTYQQLRLNIKDKDEELRLKHTEVKELSRRIDAMQDQPFSHEKAVEHRRLSIMRKMAEDRISELDLGQRSLKVEYHKKFALSFAIIIFILIGIPLGLMTRSSGIGMAFSVSSIIFLIYYVALNGGENLADKGLVSPFLAMWLSNIIFFILAIALILASIREKSLINLNLLVWRLKHLRSKKASAPDELIH
ncbi:MAG: LptF/LptG family permease [Candidatus Cloacimonetes bacterium]|nr:LptF/LptG family permease [Candidatus Cloacimonadota bacterium]